MLCHREQLIILIKEVWNVTPEARGYYRPADMQSLQSRFVSMAVDEFYKPEPTGI